MPIAAIVKLACDTFRSLTPAAFHGTRWRVASVYTNIFYDGIALVFDKEDVIVEVEWFAGS